jgi:hypothetical protein
MPKNLVITYTGGSCGDFISIPWVATQQFYSLISHHTITDSGRALPTYNDDFMSMFPKQPRLHYYSRDWTEDLDKLNNLSEPFLILTTSSEQATLIKKYFNTNVHVLSINYTKSNWPFVAGSFCSKVLDSPNYLTKDDVGEHFLNTVAKEDPVHRQQFLYLARKGVLGLWYARHLAAGHINFPPKENNFLGDTTLQLDEIFDINLLASKLQSASIDVGVTLELDSFFDVYNSWYSKQFQVTEINKILTN